MMLDNANNLLTNREEYFKAPIPVAKLSYTFSSSKESINEKILTGLANSLGEVNKEKKDRGKEPVHNGVGGGGEETLDKCGHSFCIEKYPVPSLVYAYRLKVNFQRLRIEVINSINPKAPAFSTCRSHSFY